MPNLQFDQLFVMSVSQKSGNQFQFGPTWNLITAKDNNVGKSTLVELLFWAFGCELNFDSKWTLQDCKVMVNFSIGTAKFTIHRYKDVVSVKLPNEQKQSFNKISDELAKWLAEQIGFKILLPSRKDELQVPPPAYFFLPFYIDQKKSWIKAWDGFENLGQYDNWKPTVIQYHVGLLTPEYFEIEHEKYIKKGEQRTVKVEIEKIDIALNIVDDYIPPISEAITTDTAKFELMTDEIRKDLSELSIQQESALNDLSRLQSEFSYLTHQQAVSTKIVSELDKDYLFSVENIEGDQIPCPVCGTVHDNSVYSKASILTDKQDAENQLEGITSDLAGLEKKIDKTNKQIATIKEKIVAINEKYVINEADSAEAPKVGLSDIIENIAGRSIKEKVTETKATKLVVEKGLKKEISGLNKEQNKVRDGVDRESILNSFTTMFASYTQALGAEDINAAEINSPLDYSKVQKEGGAAENVRAMVAYYLSVYNLIDKYGQDVKAPLVFDTPNQHEQSDTNYEKIIQLLLDKYPKNSQMFLCAMENDQLVNFVKVATVITLDENKILSTDKFEGVKDEFDKFEKENDELLR